MDDTEYTDWLQKQLLINMQWTRRNHAGKIHSDLPGRIHAKPTIQDIYIIYHASIKTKFLQLMFTVVNRITRHSSETLSFFYQSRVGVGQKNISVNNK